MEQSEEIWNGEKTTPYLRKKRLTQLIGAWHLITNATPEISDFWYFDENMAAICIEQYLLTRREVMERYGIKARIQRPKIAGLLAQSILSWSPIIKKQDAPADCLLIKMNERLALTLGISICAEGNLEQARTLRGHPQFRKWFEMQIHYLSKKNAHTSESLIMFFEALSLSYFPNNLIGE